jgi:hypothetical protein
MRDRANGRGGRNGRGRGRGRGGTNERNVSFASTDDTQESEPAPAVTERGGRNGRGFGRGAYGGQGGSTS